MHELSICNALITQVERIAAERDARRVTAIVLRVGPLAGVEPQLLRRAYPFAAAGTLAEQAELRVETSALRVRCDQCGAESPATPSRLLCGQCGDLNTRLVSGDEMMIESVQLEMPRVPGNPHAD